MASSPAAAAAAASTNALRVYRRLLGVAKQLPAGEKQESALQQIRQGFREHAEETDTDRISKLLEKASSTLGYLKMVTPKRRSATSVAEGLQDDNQTEEGSPKNGRTYLVYNQDGRVSGEALARERAAYSNWDGENLDPDAVRRHQHQLQRAGFRDNTHAKGGIF